MNAAALEQFETTIRPLFHAHCVKCHGNERQKAGLRLDSPAGVAKGGERGALFVAGKPDESLLVAALSWEHEDLQMPPKTKLDDASRAAVAAWIAAGAALPSVPAAGGGDGAVADFDLETRRRHWAWQPLAPVAPPDVAHAEWPRDPLDRFVLAKLEAAGLAPAEDAPRAAWLRRVSFDLIGLPPTLAEQDDFLSDLRPDARERVVDRLLASPRFGEKWARHWLDLARYAEGRGHEFDFTLPNSWAYRDWLVRALNRDVPYPDLLREHVAGDLLDPPRLDPGSGANESIVATGFWLLGEAVHSPVDIRGDECDRVANQIDTFSKAFLGVTVACARCHDHKFDAISQRDYYALAGFLAGASATEAPYETLERHRGIAREVAKTRTEEIARQGASELAAALQPAARALAELAATDSALADELLHAAAPRWWQPSPERAAVVVDFAAPRSGDWNSAGVAFGTGPLPAGTLRFSGDATAPIAGIATAGVLARDGVLDRVRAATDREVDPTRMRLLEPGRTARTRSFVLQHGKLHWIVRGKGVLFACVASHRTLEGPLHQQTLIEVDTGGHWQVVTQALDEHLGLRVHGEVGLAPLGEGASAPDLEVAALIDAAAAPQLQRRLNPRVEALGLAGAFAEACAGLAAGALAAGTLAGTATDHDAAGDQAALLEVLLRRAPAEARRGLPVDQAPDQALARLGQRIAHAASQLKDGSKVAPALLDGSAFDESLLIRGNWRTPGERVPRRFLEALGENAPPAAAVAAAGGSGRLELAERLVDPANPLVPRVAVNRVWHHLFGRGLAESVDDLGALGSPPSHPELLDTLAAEFAADGGSLKRLIRRLLLSRTWGMSSVAVDERAAELDPANVLLHRMPVRRLTAEQLRDAMLAVAGALDPTIGGPPVPIHLTPFMEGRGRPGDGPLDGNGRRTLYLSVRRNFLDPFLLAFDFPNPAATCGRRSVSNVPAQSLALMNGELAQEMARRIAQRLLDGPKSTRAAEVERLLRTVLGRPPAPGEAASLLAWLDRERSAEATDARDPAIWSDLAHILLAAKSFRFLE
jgi:cytochrome c553